MVGWNVGGDFDPQSQILNVLQLVLAHGENQLWSGWWKYIWWGTCGECGGWEWEWGDRAQTGILNPQSQIPNAAHLVLACGKNGCIVGATRVGYVT